jgi:carbamoyltransferase
MPDAWILGISAYFHDSAAALLRGGEIVAAVQEERFTRRKHDPAFPSNAIAACLGQAAIEPRDLSAVVFYEKPFLKFDRLIETFLHRAPRGRSRFGQAMPVWFRDKLMLKQELLHLLRAIDSSIDWRSRLFFSQHHLSHAASAFYPSPFESAAVLTLDGVGEWSTTTIGHGRGSDLQLLSEIRFPHSLGLLYSAFTTYCGFRVNSGEYKLMGLAPYGRPLYRERILDRVVTLRDDGSFRLNLDCFEFEVGDRMTSPEFHTLFGSDPRVPESALEQRHADLASSIQSVLDEAVLRLGRVAREKTGEDSLVMAGGVALNCVANSALRGAGVFDRIWVQPAAGDAGGALGAALAYHYLDQPGQSQRPVCVGKDSMQCAYLGPAWPDDVIESRLQELGAAYERLDRPALLERAASALADGQVVGWFQGRMEFGPRALGGRSILADPRSREMQSELNLRIKFRESFRPFAPVVRKEEARSHFAPGDPSPYMLFVDRVLGFESSGAAPRLSPAALRDVSGPLPAITHLDGSARLQTVAREDHSLLWDLLEVFERKTGCGVLVNTSFNVRGEPIVCRPEEAVRCLMTTQIHALAIGSFWVEKPQPEALAARFSAAVADD